MKKLYTTLMMAMMAMMTLSFTSCETDEEIARDLEGTWIGNMHIVDDYGVATTVIIPINIRNFFISLSYTYLMR